MQRRPPGFSALSCLTLLGSLLLGLFLAPLPVRAQSGGEPLAQLTSVNVAAFPAIEAYLLVNDAAGQRVPGLTAADFRLTENDVAVGGLSVAEENVGVQVVFVLDSTDAFKTRDVNAVTRLELIQAALTSFTHGGLRAGLDDVTILTSDGPLVEHASDPDLVAQAVADYTSAFTGVADPFTLLNTGLDFATDVAPRPGMRRFLVFLSNGLTRADVAGQLADAAARATAAELPIYTLFVGPAGGEATTGAVNLQTLAESTGGQRLLFTDAASLDPFYQVLAEHARQYRLSYRSGLAVTGQHTLAAGVTLPGGVALSAGQVVFPLRVEAPTVTLGGLPASLVRVASAAGADPALAVPAELAVPLVVDFPDGHPRGVQSAELVVDGAVVATAPATTTLTALTWPLAGYAASADHVLLVRLIDELGLAAASQALTVTVSLQEPAVVVAPLLPVITPPQVVNRPGWPLLALALTGVLLAAGVGLLAWWTLTRAQRARAAAEAQALEATRPVAPTVPNVTRPPSARSKPRPVRVVRAAPVNNATQQTAPLVLPPALPAAAPAAAPRPSGWAPRLPHVNLPAFRWPTRPVAVTLAPAYLEVVESGGGGAPQPNIEVSGPALTLGRDGALAEAIFHDRSVSRLHARLVHVQGVFRLYDAGSTSGTWLNYAPIAAGAGPELHHGDLINLGRVQLRFIRRDAPAPTGSHGARVVPVVPASISAASISAASNEAAPAANGAHAHPVAGPAAHSPAGVPAAQPVEKSE